MNTKICSRCGSRLPKDVLHFVRDRYKSDGFIPMCKQCSLMLRLLGVRRSGKSLTERFCKCCKIAIPQKSSGMKTFCSIRCKSQHYRSNHPEVNQRYRANREKVHSTYATSDKGRYSAFRSKLHREFHIVEEDYRGMVEQQRNCCDICGRFFSMTERSNTPCIDHNHKTGEVRGLLCASCNLGIGKLQDSSEVSMRAVTYLMKHGC